MNIKIFLRFFRKWQAFLPKKRQIYYVSDTENWSFYWDAYYITKGLRERVQVPACITTTPLELRNQIIQFGNRFAYLNGTFRKIHPSNQVFLTWFHGDPNSADPAAQRLYTTLREAVMYTRKIVVSCQTSRSDLMAIGIDADHLVTIPLGVDLSKFLPITAEDRVAIRTQLGIPEQAVCIGSFQKDGEGYGEGNAPKFRKGPDVFLEVVHKLKIQHSNLLVVLTGSARGYVKQCLEKIGVPYIHHQLSDYHEIVRYYHALDLYLITSRCEGGPKALLESWATGVPVVSTRVGMPADCIRHGLNGMIADVDDVDGLTHGVSMLLEDAALRECCCQQALEDVKHYDWPLIAEQYYHKLYQPLLR